MTALPASLTLADAAGVLRALVQGAAGATREALTVDASALVRFDSAALAVLLEVRRFAQHEGRPFVVANAPARLVDLARLYGVRDLLLAPTAFGPGPPAGPKAASEPAAAAAR